jgi:arginase
VYTEPMLVRNLSELRAAGMHEAASQAIAFLTAAGVEKVWLHLDADCLDDELMPAVDWRVAGGLSVTEAVSLARPLVRQGLIAGMDVTIYNPSLDTDDLAAGRVLVDVVAGILG